MPQKTKRNWHVADRSHEQDKRCYQQQARVCEVSRSKPKKFLNAAGHVRYWKKIGLGFKTPKSAINGTFVDQKCPFTGNVSIRGRILKGVCHSLKMERSVVVRRDYLHWAKKYQRYCKRNKKVSAHLSPAFTPKVGDELVIGECRPLSKTIHFNVVAHNKRGADAAEIALLGRKFGK